MIESLRLTWGGGYSAGPDPLMLDPRVDGDRMLRPLMGYEDSPAANMTPIDALQNSAWLRALNITAYTVARTPFQIKTVDVEQNGVKKSPAKDHDGYFATTHQANPEETAFEARFRITANAFQHGAGYGGIWRDAPGGLRIYPFETSEVRKVRMDGQLWYLRDLMPGSDEDVSPIERFRKFPARDVIEISGLKNRGLTAFATWWLAKNAIGDGIEAQKMRASRSRNKGRPDIAITTEQVLPEQTALKIQKDFMNIHAGFDDVGKPAVFDRGMSAVALNYAANLESEESLSRIPVRDIANYTGIPAVLLGDNEGLSYDALEKLIETLFRFGIEPYWSTWEDQIRAKILTDKERRNETHTAEFDRAAMVYMDGKTQAELIRAWGAGTPVATPNNIRAKLGWEPLDDPEADELQMPKNIGNDGTNNVPDPGDTAPNGRPQAGAVEDHAPMRSMANAWDDTTRRILKAAERVSSNDKAYMKFCDGIDSDADLIAISHERSRGSGSIFGADIHQAHAVAGLLACKSKLLDVAGDAKPGQLHDIFHEKQGVLMVVLPDLAAKAVMGASCLKI
jgi:HK97 family phage portal protein